MRCQLDAKLSRVEAERESAQAALANASEELELEQVERAKAESTARTLVVELMKLRDESRQTLETVTAWTEFEQNRLASRSSARLYYNLRNPPDEAAQQEGPSLIGGEGNDSHDVAGYCIARN